MPSEEQTTKTTNIEATPGRVVETSRTVETTPGPKVETTTVERKDDPFGDLGRAGAKTETEIKELTKRATKVEREG